MEDNNSDVTEKARKFGWVPQEEWKGDPDQWRDADEFVQRGENILPIVRDRLSKTQEKVEELERQLRATSKTAEASMKRFKEQTEKEYEEKLKELTQKGFEAAREGDFEAWEEVEQQKKDLTKPEEPGITPAFEEWKNENDWYESDETATSLAMGYGARLTADMESGKIERMPEAEFYKKISEFVRQELPHKFENPNRAEPAMVEEGGHKPVKGGKTYSDLPPKARAACKRIEDEFKAKGLQFDKDEWVKTYFEED